MTVLPQNEWRRAAFILGRFQSKSKEQLPNKNVIFDMPRAISGELSPKIASNALRVLLEMTSEKKAFYAIFPSHKNILPPRKEQPCSGPH